jgi:hypothetical protein
MGAMLSFFFFLFPFSSVLFEIPPQYVGRHVFHDERPPCHFLLICLSLYKLLFVSTRVLLRLFFSYLLELGGELTLCYFNNRLIRSSGNELESNKKEKYRANQQTAEVNGNKQNKKMGDSE